MEKFQFYKISGIIKKCWCLQNIGTCFYGEQGLANESKLETISKEEISKLLSLYYGKSDEKSEIVQRVKKAREKAAKRYNKQILKAFTFESNCDISSIEIDGDLSICDSELFSLFEQEDGVEKARLILIDPFACDEEYLDIHLRHELRHSLTSSVRSEDGLNIIKVGNTEYVYFGEKLININNEFYNELVTQQKAIENTKKSYQNGIYILSPKGVSFPNGLTSGYDEFLPEFSKIYCFLPASVLRSQIEEDNTNLYNFIQADDIKQLEDTLQESFPPKLPDDFVDSIINKNRDTYNI